MSRVLMVVTGADTLTLADGTAHPTGFWAEELIELHRSITAAGHTLDVATPNGRGATVDPGLPATGADVAQDFPFNVNGEITYPAPDTRLGHTPRKKIYKRAAGFKFGTDQNAATFQCSLNGSPFAACAKSATFKSRKGRNILSVRAVSAYGVADASPASYRWKYLKKKRR